MIDLDVHLPMFQYNRDETVVKGDQVLSDGRRVAVFTSNAHLKPTKERKLKMNEDGERDAATIHSLQKDLKESKLVIYEKDKKLKKTGERDAAIIHSLKKDLKEKEETIKALEKKKKEYIVTI